ncbi:hypothetical protein [Micromonospora lutea]|uniref:hypothetical protein n=1 Tax=Micromonospora lutea TaxID=419825 RepID=UPI00195173CC|nr:hypothetical protein [Micromonospora lutea]
MIGRRHGDRRRYEAVGAVSRLTPFRYIVDGMRRWAATFPASRIRTTTDSSMFG